MDNGGYMAIGHRTAESDRAPPQYVGGITCDEMQRHCNLGQSSCVMLEIVYLQHILKYKPRAP